MEFPQEDLSLQEQMLDPQELAKRKEEAAAAMRNSLNKWNSEREKNEEYIEQLKKRKEDRKREIEAEQALLLSMKEEDEAEAARAEEEQMMIKVTGDEQREGQQEKSKTKLCISENVQNKERKGIFTRPLQLLDI